MGRGPGSHLLLYLSASLPSNNRHLEREAKKERDFPFRPPGSIICLVLFQFSALALLELPRRFDSRPSSLLPLRLTHPPQNSSPGLPLSLARRATSRTPSSRPRVPPRY
ncbi:hypothetical protein FALCPG4_004600 [Fusarium falciforme]